ncbi:MAG TPA: hypothetical protein VF898_01480, partial [Chloroflexota bacterium]
SVLGPIVAAAAMLLLAVPPAGALAAPHRAPSYAPSAKSVSLRLGDVLQVLGRGFSAGDTRSSKPTAMGECTSTPPVTDYTVNFMGPLRTKGVLTVISDVYTYKSAAGPVCHLKYDISENKILGRTLGEMTTVHGVGSQAFLLDTTGPKTKEAPVYTLGLNFARGVYRALIIVQSNQKINAAELIKLGKLVDGRMRHTR